MPKKKRQSELTPAEFVSGMGLDLIGSKKNVYEHPGVVYKHYSVKVPTPGLEIKDEDEGVYRNIPSLEVRFHIVETGTLTTLTLTVLDLHNNEYVLEDNVAIGAFEPGDKKGFDQMVRKIIHLVRWFYDDHTPFSSAFEMSSELQFDLKQLGHLKPTHTGSRTEAIDPADIAGQAMLSHGPAMFMDQITIPGKNYSFWVRSGKALIDGKEQTVLMMTKDWVGGASLTVYMPPSAYFMRHALVLGRTDRIGNYRIANADFWGDRAVKWKHVKEAVDEMLDFCESTQKNYTDENSFINQVRLIIGKHSKELADEQLPSKMGEAIDPSDIAGKSMLRHGPGSFMASKEKVPQSFGDSPRYTKLHTRAFPVQLDGERQTLVISALKFHSNVIMNAYFVPSEEFWDKSDRRQDFSVGNVMLSGDPQKIWTIVKDFVEKMEQMSAATIGQYMPAKDFKEYVRQMLLVSANRSKQFLKTAESIADYLLQ